MNTIGSLPDVDPVEVIRAEVALVEKIERDETWYEGERRRCWVDPKDIAVQLKVADICIWKNDVIRREALEVLLHHV